MTAPASPDALRDGFGRTIDYVRLSVTDRCDLRCRYCMPRDMTFLPRRDLLTIAELGDLGEVLIASGVRRIRLTGGEPLVRRGIDTLVARLGEHIGSGLDELTLTTNGTHLADHAAMLAEAGVRRINVSLDTLDPARFAAITRGGDLARVLAGIAAARSAGLAIKINCVVQNGVNADEVPALLRWCGGEGHDLTLIETMPLGRVDDDRAARFCDLGTVRALLAQEFVLVPTLERSAGPARYDAVPELGIRLGWITPLSGNFCAGCNRIRITATGTVHGCLGHDGPIELREALREGGANAVTALLRAAIAAKPERHRFDVAAQAPAVARHMSVTGG